MSGSFTRHEARGTAFLEWHASLEEDRGARARLRRSAGPDEVIFERAFHRLLQSLERAEPPLFLRIRERRRALAALAGLAARVREHVPAPRTAVTHASALARQMGTAGARKGSMGPAVSEMRFRRLLTSTDLDDRFFQLARVIHLLGDRIDLLSLADGVFDWNDDPDLRQHWAYDYYDAAGSLPRRES